MSDNDQKRRNDDTGKRRGGGPLPVATLVPKLTRKALGKYGFSFAGLITEWDAIIGADLARHCSPEKISFPRNRRESGVLRLRAEGGSALELQHLEPQILERINGYYGYKAIAKLQFVNGPVRRQRAAPAPRATVPANTDATASIDDPGLRAALDRLGNSIRLRESNGKKC